MSKNLIWSVVVFSSALSLLGFVSVAAASAAPTKKIATHKISQKLKGDGPAGNESAKRDESAKDGQLTAKQASTLITSPGLKLLKKKADVPESVANLLPGFQSMAEPKGDFSAGCVGSAPHSRMILAAKQGNKVIVAHESGGIAFWQKVEIFETAGKETKRIYSSFIGSPVEDLASLQDAARKGTLR